MTMSTASCSSVISSLNNYINAVRAGLYFELSGNITELLTHQIHAHKYGFRDLNMFAGCNWVDFSGELFEFGYIFEFYKRKLVIVSCFHVLSLSDPLK